MTAPTPSRVAERLSKRIAPCLAVALASTLVGCWAHQPPLEYRGISTPRVDELQAILYLPTLPNDSVELGRATVACDEVGPEVRPKHAALATLDCSTMLLSRMLDELARAKGAAALIGPNCTRQPMAGRGELQSHLECEASVARLGPASMLASSRSTTASDRSSLPAATTEFRTYVEFAPMDGARSSDKVDTATEVPMRPVADRLLGIIRVRVAIPVARDEAIRAVALAALRLGAVHYESPACRLDPRKRGWVCVSRLFSPELDEGLIASSR